MSTEYKIVIAEGYGIRLAAKVTDHGNGCIMFGCEGIVPEVKMTSMLGEEAWISIRRMDQEHRNTLLEDMIRIVLLKQHDYPEARDVLAKHLAEMPT